MGSALVLLDLPIEKISPMFCYLWVLPTRCFDRLMKKPKDRYKYTYRFIKKLKGDPCVFVILPEGVYVVKVFS